MLRLWLCLLAILAFTGTSLWAQPEPSPPEMREDAELTAVFFLDADRGWAAGDRGVIWHTSDGGRNWGPQTSGTTCRLEAIQFLDANNGWAIGGWTKPYTHETHGVVLRTRDSGQTWQNLPSPVLPGLLHAKFFDARRGWALGDASPLFPTGIFRTEDGGRTWLAVPKGDATGWITGDFRDPQGGCVAGLDGTLGIVTPAEIRSTRMPRIGPQRLRRMQLVGQAGGWLVGDGGLVLTTADAGLTWRPPAGPLPPAAALLDVHALAVLGTHVWLAGSPGSVVLHSSDAGQTWQTRQTGQTAPLWSIQFLDEYRGWAVGSLGTILHTRDGGQSWRPQRCGGKRVAILGVFSEPERTPLELIALSSGSDAYYSAVEIVGRRDLERAASPADLTTANRTHAAIVAAGGSLANTAWQFPLPEAGLPISAETLRARWRAMPGEGGIGRLEEHLTLRIRALRPEVIVTEDVSPRGENPLAHAVNQATLAAVAKAADGHEFPQHVQTLGLAPWKVKKVFTLQTFERQAVVNITPAQWSPRLGRSLADVAENARSLLAGGISPSPRTIGLGLLVDHLPQETGRRDIMSGIQLGPGSEARRELSSPPPGDLEQLSRLAQKRHNVEQLLARIDRGDAAAGNWLGQIDNLTSGLPERHCGEILWQLAQRHHRAGQSESAAEAMELLLKRYPRHVLADSAALWLVRYYASSEVAWRSRKASAYTVQLVSASSRREDASQAAVPTTDKDGAPLELIDRSQRAALTGMSHQQTAQPSMTPGQRAGRVLAVTKQFERSRPTLFVDPLVQFPLSAAERHAPAAGPNRPPAEGLPLNVRGVWSSCAAAEEWLRDGKGAAPKRVLSVVTAASKPKLDGRLDDPLWQTAKSISLSGVAVEGVELPAVAALAFDDEFLYVALSCRKAPQVDYAPRSEPRPHDSDLSQVDHVALLLDVDRDYSTWWQLSVDHRGRPAASCFGDATWNPQWFIAAGGDDAWWTVEAAIPLAELGASAPKVRDVWAAQVQRVIPQHGVQAASHPASVAIRPEGFGLLVFE